MRRALHGYHPRGDEVLRAQVRRWRAHPARDLRRPRRLCDRAGACQACPVGGRAQPLQAAEPRPEGERHRTGQVQHPADRPDRLRQDASGPDAGAHPRCALHHGRCHHADRGGLCRRGCGEHHPQAAPGFGIQCRTGPAGDRLHRRGGQDHPQVGQPFHHPRCQRRGRPAGPAEDHGGHHRLRAAARRAQASPAGIPAGGHDQHPVHLRRCLCRAGKDHCPAFQGHRHGLRRQGHGARRTLRRRDLQGSRARGSSEVRPDPGIRRPPAGHRHAHGSRRGSPDPDPDRAQERSGQAVSAPLRDGGYQTHLHRGCAQGDRQARHREKDRRPRPAFDHGGDPARYHVRAAEPDLCA
ncbi:hypothetical protein ruthe_01169 [Rubellimicrobium thermophilum DSM 16684]|uniref:Uncharacterized protein n=1 Tax=Rubellimicrobium thermophilum DSM 16684 TaxID=1123069 RepID=S9SJ05_9RHOB|nr:hypothetical protein ruthe_01169 [Rubellimicrobium thermophilum DSM 16684]